jgi:signal transduction histidine kinase
MALEGHAPTVKISSPNIEAGRMELAEFDFPSTIENVIAAVTERARRRRVTIDRTIDARLGMMRGDAGKVKQLLLNLLSNALKFTPEGGRIDVTASLRGDEAEIAVKDAGAGSMEEHQAEIFDVVMQLTELHGSSGIDVDRAGGARTLRFRLPIHHAE